MTYKKKSYICICLYWSCTSFVFCSNRLVIKDKHQKSSAWKFWMTAPNLVSFPSCSAPASSGHSSEAAVTLRVSSSCVWEHWTSSGGLLPLPEAICGVIALSFFVTSQGTGYCSDLPVTHWVCELLGCKHTVAVVPIRKSHHRSPQWYGQNLMGVLQRQEYKKATKWVGDRDWTELSLYKPNL